MFWCFLFKCLSSIDLKSSNRYYIYFSTLCAQHDSPNWSLIHHSQCFQTCCTDSQTWRASATTLLDLTWKILWRMRTSPVFPVVTLAPTTIDQYPTPCTQQNMGNLRSRTITRRQIWFWCRMPGSPSMLTMRRLLNGRRDGRTCPILSHKQVKEGYANKNNPVFNFKIRIYLAQVKTFESWKKSQHIKKYLPFLTQITYQKILWKYDETRYFVFFPWSKLSSNHKYNVFFHKKK